MDDDDDDDDDPTDASRQILVANLNARVPAERFDSLFAGAKALAGATLVNEGFSVDDVTASYVDVAARAKALEATHAQLLALMGRAEAVKDVLAVQSELGRTAASLEAQKARKRSLEKQATLSTLSVTIEERPPAREPREHKRRPAVGAAVRTVRAALRVWARASRGSATSSSTARRRRAHRRALGRRVRGRRGRGPTAGREATGKTRAPALP